MTPMIQVQNLTVAKQGAAICRVLELTVQPGEHVGIVGPNGCGKTTLLRVIAGLETQFDGVCQLNVPLRQCVYVHQRPYLFYGSVLDNATYGLASRGYRRMERTGIAREWLARLGVDRLADRQCCDLSGGERRRVALARALAIGPRVLLLDEPLADLDEEGIACVNRAVADLRDTTVLVASPVPVTAPLTDRTFLFPDAV